ncbi:unnamed protein product [Staurois parvus]|uniref:Uncharacterized protein n=1 Tax=Staurois parvus TaxID=386267 RepID=A0ABN9HT76_9NEOB|nr:unnamed protein product [Staurois parvus]
MSCHSAPGPSAFSMRLEIDAGPYSYLPVIDLNRLAA